MRKLITILVLLTAPAVAEESTRQTYRTLFAEYSAVQLRERLVPMLVEQGMTEEIATEKVAQFAEASIDCHMLAMDMYPAGISEAAYDVVTTGGSYLDAKAAFDGALGAALASGDEETRSKFDEAIAAAQACLMENQALIMH